MDFQISLQMNFIFLIFDVMNFSYNQGDLDSAFNAAVYMVGFESNVESELLSDSTAYNLCGATFNAGQLDIGHHVQVASFREWDPGLVVLSNRKPPFNKCTCLTGFQSI